MKLKESSGLKLVRFVIFLSGCGVDEAFKTACTDKAGFESYYQTYAHRMQLAN